MNVHGHATRRWCAALAGVATLLGVGTVSAATINVTTTSMAASPSGCGFVEALQALNTKTAFGGCTAGNGSNDIINLPAGTYTATGTLYVERSVELRGAGVGQTVVRANLSSGSTLFYVTPTSPLSSGEPWANVRFQDLTIDRAAAQAAPNVTGIWANAWSTNALNLTLDRVRVTGHTWGGVFAEGTGVAVHNSVIDGNSSPTSGGGIAVLNSFAHTGSTNIFWSTIANNSSEATGGGLYHEAQGNSHLDFSTVSGNHAQTGGGVSLHAVTDYFQMDGATIAFNTAIYGGGVVAEGSGNYYIFSTLVAENTVTGWFKDWDGYATTMTECLIGDSAGLELLLEEDAEYNLFDVSPGLDAALADLGGPYHTPVHRLLPGSPAIDYFDCSTFLEQEDQRHFPRAVNGDGIGGSGCDIGAFEYDPNWQTETLLVAAKSSDTHVVVTDSNYSNGEATHLQSNAANDYVTYAVPVPASGNYSVKVRVKRGFNRGRFQLGVSNSPTGTFTNVGSTQDLYSSSFSFVELNISNSTSLTRGMRYFRFFVNGKNAASSGYQLVLDTVKLTKL